MKLKIYLRSVVALALVCLSIPIYVGSTVPVGAEPPPETDLAFAIAFCLLLLVAFFGWIRAWKLLSVMQKRGGLAYVLYLAMMILWLPLSGPLALYLWGRERVGDAPGS